MFHDTTQSNQDLRKLIGPTAADELLQAALDVGEALNNEMLCLLKLRCEILSMLAKTVSAESI